MGVLSGPDRGQWRYAPHASKRGRRGASPSAPPKSRKCAKKSGVHHPAGLPIPRQTCPNLGTRAAIADHQLALIVVKSRLPAAAARRNAHERALDGTKEGQAKRIEPCRRRSRGHRCTARHALYGWRAVLTQRRIVMAHPAAPIHPDPARGQPDPADRRDLLGLGRLRAAHALLAGNRHHRVLDRDPHRDPAARRDRGPAHRDRRVCAIIARAGGLLHLARRHLHGRAFPVPVGIVLRRLGAENSWHPRLHRPDGDRDRAVGAAAGAVHRARGAHAVRHRASPPCGASSALRPKSPRGRPRWGRAKRSSSGSTSASWSCR